ncbi:MAG: YitT family protein [Clostridia bacterium]|nr:YitT family protein [Lachnospiraceae bacterium]NCB99390.1 YitT family protein [Clostridia bacterium]NCD01507.1 YitT family protein [Clostridia bacterium]
MERKNKGKERIIDLLVGSVGIFIMSLGIHCFMVPANIAPGGLSGLGILARYLWGLPIGLTTFVMNVPIFILSWKYLGKKYTIQSFVGVLLSTVILDYIVTPWIPMYMGERLLSSVFGGIFMGAGLGMIFLRGFSTGGTDAISFLVQLKYPHMPIGRALMVVDGLVLAISVVVFHNIEAGLFGVVALFFQTKVIDSIIYGSEHGQMFFIVSQKNMEIKDRILEDIDRGATILKGVGAYTMEERDVLLCAARKSEFGQIKRIVREIDPDAFFIVSEVSQILGEGFKPVV